MHPSTIFLALASLIVLATGLQHVPFIAVGFVAGVAARSLPYTTAESGRVPFEGVRMEEIERLRAGGWSEKQIMERFKPSRPVGVVKRGIEREVGEAEGEVEVAGSEKVEVIEVGDEAGGGGLWEEKRDVSDEVAVEQRDAEAERVDNGQDARKTAEEASWTEIFRDRVLGPRVLGAWGSKRG